MKFRKHFLLFFFILFSVSVRAETNEKELFVVAQRAFEDGFYDVSIRYLDQLLGEFPASSKNVEARLLQGQCFFFKKQYLKAFAVFQDLVRRGEYKDVTLFWLGETYLKVGDHVKAREQYQTLIDGYKGSLYLPQAFYSLGWSLFEQGEYEEAERIFLKLIELFPSSNLTEDAAFKAGECAYNAGRYEAAVQRFTEYTAAHASSQRLSEALFNIGEALYYLERFDESAEAYDKARKAAAVPAEVLSAIVGRGWSLFKKTDFPGAMAVFVEAEDYARRNDLPADDVYLGKASLLTAQEKYALAADCYGELLERYPSSLRAGESYLGRANAWYLTGEYAKAINDYTRLITLFDGKEEHRSILEKARFGLAWTYLKNGDINSSIASFQEVFERAQTKSVKASALTQIGDAYQETGRMEKAIETYDRILKEFPDTPFIDYVQFRLGVALLKTEKYEASVLAFQALAANYPKSKYLSESRYYLGVAYFKKRDWTFVLDLLEPFIKETPSQNEFSSEARHLVALSFFNLKKYDKALEVFQAMQKLYPSQKFIQQNVRLGIAKVHYEQERLKESLDEFRDILRDYPGTDAALESLLWLGENAMASSDYAAAEKIYTQLLRDFPQSEKQSLANYELGRAYHAQGILDRAVASYRKVDAQAEASLGTRAHLAIADIFSREMDPALAEETYRNIAQTSPDYKRDALVKIAHLFRRTGRSAEELKAYEEALAAKMGASRINDANLLFQMGEALETGSHLDDAVAAYAKVTYLYSSEVFWVVKAFLRIANIYENKEEWDKALTAYNKVAEMKVDEAKFAQERIAWIVNNRDKQKI